MHENFIPFKFMSYYLRKATGNHLGKYMIRETVSMQLHHSVAQTCHHGVSSGVSPVDII